MSIFTDVLATRVLTFWFPSHALTSRTVAPALLNLWFRTNPEFDVQCQEFKPTIDHLLATTTSTTIPALASTPHRSLALIILLNQITRNLNRDNPLSLAGDAHARAVADWALDPTRRFDLGDNGEWKLAGPTRLWFVVPFEHAEDAECLKRALKLSEDVEADVKGHGEDGEKFVGLMKGYVEEFGKTFERFGRFPHRNEMLGRESSEEEKKFIEEKRAQMEDN